MTEVNAAKAGAGPSERIHALDGLRTTMLLLVVLYHCLLSYIAAPSRNWPFKDASATVVADLILRFVHAFTLPTFFIMAGFFSAMLYVTRGPEAFTHNRAMRIALPFAVGWLALHPIVGAGFVFARTVQSSSFGDGASAVWAAVFDGSLLFPNSTMHLWFMYDLIFFYAVTLALVPLVLRAPAAWRDGALRSFGFVTARPWLRFPVFALITMGMLRIVGGTLYASLSFVPNGRLLLGYGMYFVVGWLFYLKRDEILKFERFAWTHVVAGLAIFFLVGPFATLLAGGPLPRPVLFFLTIAVGATVVWLLFFGFTGLFLRHFNRPSPAVRYVVDASFWIYLAHLPLAIWLPGLFSGLTLPAGLKILMVFGTTLLVGFATYDLFVRSTSIGLVLNGRRHPRTLFGASRSVPA